LEIGTPFSLPGGTAIVLYLAEEGQHLLVSDNGDTLVHLASLGLDVWNPQRQKALRSRLGALGMTLGPRGDLRCIARQEQAAFVFARAVSALISAADWAADQLQREHEVRDLPAEAEPYIRARNPGWTLETNVVVRGASDVLYTFDFLHGPDLIDVIAPVPQASGGAMRKAGDVLNGPSIEGTSPLIIVDDREHPKQALQEVSIIASVARAETFTRLMTSLH
jgi:hypothetical protein